MFLGLFESPVEGLLNGAMYRWAAYMWHCPNTMYMVVSCLFWLFLGLFETPFKLQIEGYPTIIEAYL